MEFKSNTSKDKPSNKKFGFSLAILIFIVMLIFIYLGYNLLPKLLIFINLTILFIAIKYPNKLSLINLAFEKISEVISFFINPIILFLFYFFIIYPSKFIKFKNKKSSSNWQKVDNHIDYHKMF